MIPKCRAWDKVNKEMIEDVASIHFRTEMIATSNMYFYPFKDIELMQSTDLYDKKTKEIYYDDILKCDDGTLLVVDGVRTHSFLDLNMHLGYEVIGNIYENEDLLE